MTEIRYTIEHHLIGEKKEYLKDFTIGNNEFSLEWTTKISDCHPFIDEVYPAKIRDLIQYKAPGAWLKVIRFEIHIGKNRKGNPLGSMTCFCPRNGDWTQDEKQKGQCKHCKKPIITS